MALLKRPQANKNKLDFSVRRKDDRQSCVALPLIPIAGSGNRALVVFMITGFGSGDE